MLGTFLKWRVKTGREEEFRKAWVSITKRLWERGSYGSALFRSDDGCLCAFARWPDRETRDAAFAADAEMQPDTRTVRECTEELVHRIDMDALELLWIDSPHDRGRGRSG